MLTQALILRMSFHAAFEGDSPELELDGRLLLDLDQIAGLIAWILQLKRLAP